MAALDPGCLGVDNSSVQCDVLLMAGCDRSFQQLIGA
jgi:hypothetical protein